MLYGHIESVDERLVTHLVKLREHQDVSLAESPGFTSSALMPLPLHPGWAAHWRTCRGRAGWMTCGRWRSAG
jgi:2-iminoacetate synthase ThiH